MANEYARCPDCDHQAKRHDLEGCTVFGCACLLDTASAAQGTTTWVMWP